MVLHRQHKVTAAPKDHLLLRRVPRCPRVATAVEMALVLWERGAPLDLLGIGEEAGVAQGEPHADFMEIRCLEIQGWLDRNSAPKRFVILDDEGDMGPLQPHLVQTDSFKGLTDELTDRVITQFSFSGASSSRKSEAQD